MSQGRRRAGERREGRSQEHQVNPAFGLFRDRPAGDEGSYLTVSDPSLT
jgi:hypothetical protein